MTSLISPLLKKYINMIRSIVRIIISFITQRTLESNRQIKLFGIVFFINYPLYYFIWTFGSQQGYENLGLRISASIACIPLIFIDYWPLFLKRLQPLYWYSSITFCLPFFFVFMTLQNHASTAWLLNLILALLLIFLLLDVISLCFVSIVGFVLAWIAFIFTANTEFIFDPGTINLFGALATFFAMFVIGGLFAYNREKILNEKTQTIKTIGSSMAHEVRTPLRTIKLSAGRLHKFISGIEKNKQQSATALIDNIETETQAVSNIIDMLLIKSNLQPVNTSEFKACEVKYCISEALRRYAFDVDEAELVHWDDTNAFSFNGDTVLVIHILFNLLKNALYYIKAAGKGEIYIWSDSDEKSNHLYFKDTGTGMPKKILSHIFDQFYSKTPHGTGIGLAFCKMVMQNMGGDIRCRSVEGEYTEFTLNFPKEV